MQTVLTSDAEEAAEFIKAGGICAFPTETVYGLGANVFDEAAIAGIFEAKRRPADNPLIAHVSTLDQIAELTTEITESAVRFMDVFFPGPLTLVLSRSAKVPLIATAGLETIGVRMPRFDVARQFLEHSGVPVAAPSANLSGRPSPTTWQAVFEDLDGRIDCILQGEATEIGLESTVVDCTGADPVLLRRGSISLEELRSVMPGTVAGEENDHQAMRSPGLRHRHYSPHANVRLFENGTNIPYEQAIAFIGLRKPDAAFTLSMTCSSVEQYAKNLFAFFRECDAIRIDVIYCESVPETGIGAALMDRLRRAAE